MPQRELSTLQLAPQHLQLLQALLHKHVPEAQVWAYGSRVTGGAHEGSDLDVVLRNPADLQHELANWFELKEALQDSDLPLLVELHLWSHLPKTFHPNIEAAYVELQAGKASFSLNDQETVEKTVDNSNEPTLTARTEPRHD